MLTQPTTDSKPTEERGARSLHLAPGQEIFAEGSLPTALYQVEIGCIKLVRSSTMGRDTISETLLGGDYFDLPSVQDGLPYLVGAYATSTGPARVRRIDRQVALADAALLQAAQQQYWDRYRFQRRLSSAIASERVEQRALMALAMLGERCGVRSGSGLLTFPMPLSRQEFGELIGTTTETAIRVLSDLRKRGWLKEENRFFTLGGGAQLAETLAAA